jgi:pyridoxal 5'-phosphate synthase pdxT subunit
MKRVVGVLALQGAFSKHIVMLRQLGVDTIEVRKPQNLQECDALIIPGGESTVMMNRIHTIHLFDALDAFAEEKPVFGTCAGLILMANEVSNHPISPFGWIDIVVERNGFGRQIDSFHTNIALETNQGNGIQDVNAMFIRAPRIVSCGEGVRILAKFNGEPVCVQYGKHLATTFHPELTEDLSLHSYFLRRLCRNHKNSI